MTTTRLLPLFLRAGMAFLPFACLAQNLAPIPAPALARAGSSTVLERGPHHRVVEWTGRTADANGQSLTFTNHYTEVATGLHYRDEKGRWQETVAEFVRVPGGYVAARGPHQVALTADISTPGAVTIVTPEGRTLHSAPVLLAYIDHASGETVRLADLKPATGELIAPNVVLYTDAFDTLAADVRATYTAGGFECDVILRKQLPDPATLGLDPETTEIAVYSEWPGARPDRAEARKLPFGKDALTDTALGFDSMAMDQGRAFGLESKAHALEGEVPVRKSWQEIEGHPYLIERTSYKALKSLLGDLPGADAPTPQQRQRWRKLNATAQLELPARQGGTPAWARESNGRLVARQNVGSEVPTANLATTSPRQGLVLDYTVVNTTTNYTFDSLTTYYISGPVTLSGTVTFQPGTVIKFAATNTAGLTVSSGATLNWLGAPYRPVTLTSLDDNSSGEPLPGASGTPSGTYASPAALRLDSVGSVTLTNLCVRNALRGVMATGTTQPTVRHAQFVDTTAGVRSDLSVTLQNVLFDNVFYVLWSNTTNNSTGDFVTADSCSTLNHTPGGGTLSLTNSLIVAATDTNACYLNNNDYVTSSFTFTTVGGGAHYVSTSQLYYLTSLAATTPDLIAEMALQTVSPPLALGPTLNADRLLDLRVMRETYTDFLLYIGYHYWPVDYYVKEAAITNATLTLTNGAVMAFAGTNGIVLGSGARFLSQGRPELLNRLAWASTVQERPGGGSTASYRRMFYLTNTPSTRPDLVLRLTRAEFAADTTDRRALVEDGNNFMNSFSLRDCQLFGAKVQLIPSGTPGPTVTVGLTNNVFDTCLVNINHYYDEHLDVALFNNLFLNGNLGLSYITNTYNPTWTVKDNLFVGTGLSGGSTYVQAGNNGYTAASAFWGGTGNKTSLVTTGAGGFQTGPLGSYYYPSSGGSTTLYALVDTGSQTAANAGLYHYTTQTSSTKEGTSLASSQVDIGFHYVATGVLASEGFSSTQAANNWYYYRVTALGTPNIYDTSTQLTYVPYSGGDPYSPRWEQSNGTQLYCWVAGGWQHPGNANDSVRVYYIPQSGSLTVNGSAYDGGPANGDGVKARIMNSSGTYLLSGAGVDGSGWKTVPDSTTSGAPVSLSVTTPVTVGQGQYLFFELNKISNNNGDLTYWDPNIVFNLPLDTDGDLLPDYLEDTNGNGVVNTGESNWTLADADGDALTDYQERIYGTNPSSSDSDGDGQWDGGEIFQGTNPSSTNSVWPALLGDWRFNTAGSLTNEQGVAPLNGANASLTPSYENWAVVFGTNVASTNVLRYPVSTTNGTVLPLSWGTVRLTYVPDWFFGHTTDAPGQICRLLECGAWQLNISADGNHLQFQTPSANGTGTNLTMSVLLPRSTVATTNHTAWEIQLEYCSAYSRIFVNGTEQYDESNTFTRLGDGVHLPAGLVTTNGFCVGSAADGTAGARGYLDQLSTWNAVMAYNYFNGGQFLTTPFGSLQDLSLLRRLTLSATTATNGLDLHWLRGWEGDPAANAGNYNLERRAAGGTTWTVVATNVFSDTWRDTNAAAGVYYEYRLPRPGTTSGTNYWPTLLATRQGTPIESRGKVILLVDSSLTTALASDLTTFTNDLVGDGWTVARYDVPRHTNSFWDAGATNLYYKTNLLANRQIISNEWRMNTNGTNVVIIFGHVTVPYSGNGAEDGHTYVGGHLGAWPSDAWYADVDGNWGDTNSNSNPDPYMRNLGGDFKWDPTFVNDSTNLTFELSVGRIDFDDLPGFATALGATNTQDVEVKLLKRYLAKDHAYRRGDYSFDPSLRVYDDNKNVAGSDPFSQMRTDAAGVSARFFGTDLGHQTYADAFRASADTRVPTLWAMHGGFGHLSQVEASFGNLNSVTDLAPQTRVGDFAFGILSGSWFGDWNLPYDDIGTYDNGLLRACLSQPTNGLAVMWDLSGLNGPWTFPTQSVGDPLAPALLAALRSGGRQSVRTSFILGDPTLRFAQVKPTGTPTATSSTNNVILNWSASGTTGAGYWVYATTNLATPSWTRLTTGAPITSLSYTNNGAASTTNRYMVRAVALQTTGSGSYTNLSQGAFVTYP
jgi:hypothetical protein